ncbi:hypothetical protein RFI_28652, partial [Reticulomyxa filosa]
MVDSVERDAMIEMENKEKEIENGLLKLDELAKQWGENASYCKQQIELTMSNLISEITKRKETLLSAWDEQKKNTESKLQARTDLLSNQLKCARHLKVSAHSLLKQSCDFRALKDRASRILQYKQESDTIDVNAVFRDISLFKLGFVFPPSTLHHLQ